MAHWAPRRRRRRRHHARSLALFRPQVLGIPRNADSVSIQRAYKKRLAEVKGRDEAAQQRIEAAHSAIMMASLTSRLQARRCAAKLRPRLLAPQ